MSQPHDPYTLHHGFVGPAWARSEWWRVVLMMIGCEAAFLLSPLIVEALIPLDTAKELYRDQTTAFGTLGVFFSFGPALISFLVLLRLIHHRSFWSVVGPRDSAIQDLKRGAFAVTATLLLVEIFPPWHIIGDLAEVRDLSRWFALLPVAMLALLIQTGTEEIYFRGYLQQQFACFSSSRWVWMGAPSLIFGLAHYGAGQGPADGMFFVIWATMLGVCCADLTARTGNIGAAVGLHLSNNAFALLLYGMKDGPTSGLALFLYPYVDPEEFDYNLGVLATLPALFEIITMCATVLVMWLAVRLAIRR